MLCKNHEFVRTLKEYCILGILQSHVCPLFSFFEPIYLSHSHSEPRVVFSFWLSATFGDHAGIMVEGDGKEKVGVSLSLQQLINIGRRVATFRKLRKVSSRVPKKKKSEKEKEKKERNEAKEKKGLPTEFVKNMILLKTQRVIALLKCECNGAPMLRRSLRR